MDEINHVRSLLFWQREKPLYLAQAAARGTHIPCPICHGQHALRLTRPGAPDLVIDCACYTLLYQGELARLAGSLDQAPAALPGFAELTPRADECPDWTAAIDDLLALTRAPEAHTWVVLAGKPGTGKTHLLLATRKRLAGLAAFVEASTLSEQLFLALKTQGFAELIEDLVTVPVLLLDDLGTEHAGSDLIATAFSNILNRRFARALDFPTVISTNLQDDQLAARYPRVLSRMEDPTLITRYDFLMPSFRPRKGGALPPPPAPKYGFNPGGPNGA